jgi:hypothetical protein
MCFDRGVGRGIVAHPHPGDALERVRERTIAR